MSSRAPTFPLDLNDLRALAGWAVEAADRALPAFEIRVPNDPRPREALDGARAFAAGGPRTNLLRKQALAAFAAAGQAPDAASSAAARAACLAASTAYTHPLVDVQQTKHVVGPVAEAALALESAAGGDQAVGDAEVARALASVPESVGRVLGPMPTRGPGKTRVDALMARLDREIRDRCGSPGRGPGASGRP